jgi:hypothetical protein
MFLNQVVLYGKRTGLNKSNNQNFSFVYILKVYIYNVFNLSSCKIYRVSDYFRIAYKWKLFL